MDYTIDINAAGRPEMSFVKTSGLFNNVFLSLTIKQGAWWQDPSFGLKDRGRQKNTERTASLFRDDIRAALQWLLNSGRAIAVDVVTEIDRLQDRNRLKARVSVTAANGQTVTFDKFTEVV